MRKFITDDYIKRTAIGKGVGEKEDYIPFFSVNELHSYGRSHRVNTWLRKRYFDLLSDLEKACLYEQLWKDDTYDIREQFPLNPFITLELCKRNNIKHPITKINNENEAVVITQDFMVTKLDCEGKKKYTAINCKYKKKSENKSMQNRMEIEKLFIENYGGEWRLFTEEDICKNLVFNLDNGLRYYWSDYIDILTCENVIKFLDYISDGCTRKLVSLKNVLEIYSKIHDISYSNACTIFLHCVMRKYITFDLKKNKLDNLERISANEVSIDYGRCKYVLH